MTALPRAILLNGSGQPGGGEIVLESLAAATPGARVLLLEDGPVADRLRARGVDVSISAMPESVRKVSKESGLPGPRVVLGAIAHVRTLVAELRQADVVHCNNQKAWAMGAVATFLARRPVVWHLHDILDTSHFSRSKIRLAVWLSRWRRAKVVCNSHASMEAFVAAGGDRSRAEVLYNPVDPSPFLSAAPIDGFRQSLGAAEGDPVFGLFSRLASWKGQHVAIEALSRLPRGHLVLVGSPFFGEEPWETRLRELVGSLGLEARVHFLGFRSDIPRLLASIDGAIHASTAAEPFGLVILEAQLAARPVVATRGGGADEIVRDAADGWLVPPSDPTALAAVLAAWLDNPNAAQDVGRTARERALVRFAPAALLARFHSILAEEASR